VAAALLGNNQGDSHVNTELFGNSPDPCATIFKALFTDHANKKLHNTMEHTLDLYILWERESDMLYSDYDLIARWRKCEY
jgi:hypothetical protein